MQLALVDNQRVEAFTGGRGTCPTCLSTMIAKCGTRVINHWAHYKKRECDPWWENETQWHRDWKNLFPIECREVNHVAHDGEVHRADIKTPTGIVIEIQHSSITDIERKAREDFYKNLVWVVDGKSFQANFDIYHMLPDPQSEVAQDIVWSKAQRHMQGSNNGIFFRLSEAKEVYPELNITKENLQFGLIHSFQEIKTEIEKSYNGYHQYDWIRPRKTWIEAQCPVYIDFGDEFLVKLENYDASNLHCIRLVAKQKFIHDVMIKKHVHEIASRFYPLSNEK